MVAVAFTPKVGNFCQLQLHSIPQHSQPDHELPHLLLGTFKSTRLGNFQGKSLGKYAIQTIHGANGVIGKRIDGKLQAIGHECVATAHLQLLFGPGETYTLWNTHVYSYLRCHKIPTLRHQQRNKQQSRSTNLQSLEDLADFSSPKNIFNITCSSCCCRSSLVQLIQSCSKEFHLVTVELTNRHAVKVLVGRLGRWNCVCCVSRIVRDRKVLKNLESEGCSRERTTVINI